MEGTTTSTTIRMDDVVSSTSNNNNDDEILLPKQTFVSELLPPVQSSLITDGGNKVKQEEWKIYPYVFIPLDMGGDSGRTYVPSAASKQLIEKEVPLSSLVRMTTFFYEQAYQDTTLDTFIRSHLDPHPERFAK